MRFRSLNAILFICDTGKQSKYLGSENWKQWIWRLRFSLFRYIYFSFFHLSIFDFALLFDRIISVVRYYSIRQRRTSEACKQATDSNTVRWQQRKADHGADEMRAKTSGITVSLESALPQWTQGLSGNVRSWANIMQQDRVKSYWHHLYDRPAGLARLSSRFKCSTDVLMTE